MSDQIENTEKKSGAGVWILITVLAILAAGTFIFLYTGEKKAKNDALSANKQLKREMADMNQALSGYIDETTQDLRKDFQSMLATYDAMLDQGSADADSLNAQKIKINSLLAELDDANKFKRRSYSQINKLKTENETLRGIMKGYLYQIDSLNTMNLDLTNRLDETSNQLSASELAREEAQRNADINQELVNAGAKLNAYNFNSFAYRYKSNGSIDPTNRARRTDGFKAEFTVGDNKIAKAGNKFIYMQVVDPNGNILYSRANNTTTIDGKTVLYSDKREINYQKQAIDVAVVFNLQEKEIESGNYTVKIFADGTMIGKDSFTLK